MSVKVDEERLKQMYPKDKPSPTDKLIHDYDTRIRQEEEAKHLQDEGRRMHEEWESMLKLDHARATNLVLSWLHHTFPEFSIAKAEQYWHEDETKRQRKRKRLQREHDEHERQQEEARLADLHAIYPTSMLGQSTGGLWIANWDCRKVSRARSEEQLRQKYGAGGEGADHQRLKDWVYRNSQALGLRGVIRKYRVRTTFW